MQPSSLHDNNGQADSPTSLSSDPAVHHSLTDIPAQHMPDAIPVETPGAGTPDNDPSSTHGPAQQVPAASDSPHQHQRAVPLAPDSPYTSDRILEVTEASAALNLDPGATPSARVSNNLDAGYDSDGTVEDEDIWDIRCEDQATGKIFICKRAVCGHPMHPAHVNYRPNMCPVCQSNELTTALNNFQEQIREKGGVFSFKKENEEAHKMLVMGHKGRKRMYTGLPVESWPSPENWRGAKADLANYQMRLEDLKEIEVDWEGQNIFVQNAKRGLLDFDAYSATKALEMLEAFQKDYYNFYVHEDPAKTIIYNISVSDTLLDEERAQYFEREERRKKRKIEHRYDEKVQVSAEHVANGLQRTIERWGELNRRPETIKGLTTESDEVRSRSYFNRRSTNYQPGRWMSPEGHEKLDTSMVYIPWDELIVKGGILCEADDKELELREARRNKFLEDPEESAKEERLGSADLEELKEEVNAIENELEQGPSRAREMELSLIRRRLDQSLKEEMATTLSRRMEARFWHTEFSQGNF